MKIALIKWIDSNQFCDQLKYDYQFDFATITSSGMLIEEDDDKVVITQDDMEDSFRSTLVIPKVAIKSFDIVYSDEDSKGMSPTFFRTITESPVWKDWVRYQESEAHEYDVNESMELGFISPEHWEAFMRYIQDQKPF